MLEPADLIDFAKRYTAAWCSQDAASVAAFYSPNGSLCINDGVPSVGRAAITQAAEGFMTAFPDLEVLMGRVVLCEKNAEYHWTLTGTNTGPSGTSRRVKISGFEVWTIGADALIAESNGNFDGEDYQRQLARV